MIYTMKILGTQVGNRSRIFFVNITKLLTAKHEQETAANSLARRRDAMAVFPTGVRKSTIFTVLTRQELSSTKNIIVELHSNGIVV